MANDEVVREWLGMAEQDFGFARLNLEGSSNAFYPQICFHFQQSAEKYLKAFIISRGLPLKKTHDLSYLVDLCSEAEKSLIQLKDDCDFLTDFYIETRYPVHWPSQFDKKEAVQAQEAAERIRECILFFAAKKDKKKNMTKKKNCSVLKRVAGSLRGKIKIAEDFDQLSPQITKLFGLKKQK